MNWRSPDVTADYGPRSHRSWQSWDQSAKTFVLRVGSQGPWLIQHLLKRPKRGNPYSVGTAVITSTNWGPPREQQVVELASQGLTDKEIAARLKISRETVMTYWKRIRGRLGGVSRAEIVAQALTMKADEDHQVLQTENDELSMEIARREEAEAKLRDTVVRLKVLMDHLDEGVLFEDAERKILYCNIAFTAIFQVPASPEQLVGFDCRAAAEQSAHLFLDPVEYMARAEEILLDQKPVRKELIALTGGWTILRDYAPIEVDGVLKGHMWQFRPLVHPLALGISG